MAIDSLFGGSGGNTLSPVSDAVTPQSAALLNLFLNDTVVESIVQTDFGNGAQAIVGTNAGGGIKGAIIPSASSPIAGTVSDAGLSLSVSLPVGSGVLFSGINNASPANSNAFLQEIINTYLPSGGSPATTALANSLINSVNNVTARLSEAGANNIVLRLIELLKGRFVGNDDLNDDSLQSLQQALSIIDGDGDDPGIDSLVGASHIVLDAGISSGTQLFAINLAGAAGKSVGLFNVEAAVLAAPGTVLVEDNTPVYISSDNSAQSVAGGGGNDTLVGTGNDTLTGGAGSDIFGFSGSGKYTITDFDKTNDLFAFDLPGISTFDQLKASVTGVVKNAISTTYQLGGDTSITLIGVTPSDLTAGMFRLNLNNDA